MPTLTSRLPQPARLRQSNTKVPIPHSSPVASHHPPTDSNGSGQARRSFLSPKSHWSPTLNGRMTSPRPVAKYQLRDPGAVPGSPKVNKRNFAAPSSTSASTSTTIKPQPQAQVQAPLGRSSHTTKTKIPAPPQQPVATPTTKSGAVGGAVPVALGIPQPRPYFPPSLTTATKRTGMSTMNSPASRSPMSSVSVAATVATALPTPRRRTGMSSPSPRTQMPIPTIRPARGVPRPDTQPNSWSSLKSTMTESNHRHIGINTSNPPSSLSISNASTRAGTTISSRAPSPSQPRHSGSPEMTLIWQPDPESLESEVDPAENLWKEIESRLGGRRMTGKAKRGQWVLAPKAPVARNPAPAPAPVSGSGAGSGFAGYDTRHANPDLGSTCAPRDRAQGSAGGYARSCAGEGVGEEGVEMERADSEFTVSAYFDPDLTTPRPQFFPHPTDYSVSDVYERSDILQREGTAIFDMSAPLIYSRSNESATPANTPQIHPETIRRAPRVVHPSRSRSSASSSSCRPGSDPYPQSHSHSSISPRPPAWNLPGTVSTGSTLCSDDAKVSRPGVHRLDSHVVAALQALGGATPGVGLDMALEGPSSSFSSRPGSYTSADTGSTSTDTIRSEPTESTRIDGEDLSAEEEEGNGGMGLGMGMHIRLDSIYTLLNDATSRYARRAQISQSSDFSAPCARESVRAEEELELGSSREKERERGGSLVVTDLDTGHKLDLSLSRLDEMTLL